MNSQETPASLNEACQRFSRFLQQNDYPEQIVWVEQADLVWDQRHLCVCVRERPTQIAWDHASQRYEEGIRNGNGVLLLAFSQLGETSVAAVILPKDDDAAQRHLIPRSGLKLSAATKKLSARRFTNRLTWLIQSARNRTASRLFWDEYLGCP
jgi:hypothetical protein